MDENFENQEEKIERTLEMIEDDATPTPGGTQICIPSRRQQKGEESRHTP